MNATKGEELTPEDYTISSLSHRQCPWKREVKGSFVFKDRDSGKYIRRRDKQGQRCVGERQTQGTRSTPTQLDAEEQMEGVEHTGKG